MLTTICPWDLGKTKRTDAPSPPVREGWGEGEKYFDKFVILSGAKNLWPFNLKAEILRRLLLLRMTK